MLAYVGIFLYLCTLNHSRCNFRFKSKFCYGKERIDKISD